MRNGPLGVGIDVEMFVESVDELGDKALEGLLGVGSLSPLECLEERVGGHQAQSHIGKCLTLRQDVLGGANGLGV